MGLEYFKVLDSARKLYSKLGRKNKLKAITELKKEFGKSNIQRKTKKGRPNQLKTTADKALRDAGFDAVPGEESSLIGAKPDVSFTDVTRQTQGKIQKNILKSTEKILNWQ